MKACFVMLNDSEASLLNRLLALGFGKENLESK
jgi:hypothetical protein